MRYPRTVKELTRHAFLVYRLDRLIRVELAMARLRESGAKLWLPYRPARGPVRDQLYAALWRERDTILRSVQDLPV